MIKFYPSAKIKLHEIFKNQQSAKIKLRKIKKKIGPRK